MTKIATRTDINFYQGNAFNAELTRCVTLGEVRNLGLTVSSTETNNNKLAKLSDIERGNTFIIAGLNGSIVKFSLVTHNYKEIKLGEIYWCSIVASSSGYALVGYGGYTSYSTDGENWNKPKQIGTEAWLSVTRSASGMYVAVGENGNCMYGYEDWRNDEGGRYCVGITWATPQKIGNVNWYTVTAFTHGNVSGFIAAGADGRAMKSTDGRNWTAFTVNREFDNTYLCSLSHGGKLEIAGSGGILSYSDDNGETWITERFNDDGGSYAQITGIAYKYLGDNEYRYCLTGLGNIIGTGNLGENPLNGPGMALLSHNNELYALADSRLNLLNISIGVDYSFTEILVADTLVSSSFKCMAVGTT